LKKKITFPRGRSAYLRSPVGNFSEAAARSGRQRPKSEACLDGREHGGSVICRAFASRRAIERHITELV
jgi:hypothetical protein